MEGPEDGPTLQRPSYAIQISYFILILGAIIAVVFSYFGFSFQGRKIDSLDYEGRVKHILDTTPLIDGHNDLPYLLRIELQNKIYDSEEFNFWDGKNRFRFTWFADTECSRSGEWMLTKIDIYRTGKSYRFETTS
jgi:hypothetical protein